MLITARSQRRRGARLPEARSSSRYQLLGDVKNAVEEMRKLADTYGGRSAWAKANKDRPKTVQHARTMAEELIRTLAKTLHAEAQHNEKTTKVVDKERYARAAEAYQFYLANFPDASDAVELRYLRADILYFKLQKYDDAGREYLAVGKTTAGRQVPQGRAAAGDDVVREAAQADRRRGRRRQARDHRQRSPVRRGGRRLRHAVPEGQGDRHRHLQERAVLLRLRRLRRGDQALRPDRRALSRRSPTPARPATRSSRRWARPRTTRTSRAGRGASRRPRPSRRRTSRRAWTS